MSTTTIGKVAYIATWDASQLVKGVMTSRQQFSAQKKIIESLKSPLERYVTGLENLQSIVKKYPEVARHQFKMEQDLERQYLAEAKAIRVLSTEESKRLKVLNYAAGQRSAGGVARRSPAELKAENDRMNRERGLAEQERIRRYTVAVAREAEIGRRGLSERLKLYKAEKAAEHRRTRDQQTEFDRQLAAARSAMKFRDQMRREDLARTMKYFHDEKAWMTAGGPAAKKGGGIGLGMGAAALRAGSRFAAAAGIGLTAYEVVNFTKDAADMNRELERTDSALNVFTGSFAGSAKMIRQMRELSADTGVSFSAFNSGARTMMQFGVATDAVLPKLREISIVTGGNPERMKALSLAFSQVSAAGKLMGQELLQMVNAGWSPFEEIGKRLRKSVPELRKEMEAGGISAQMVADALTAATEAGGRYHGFLEALEGTSARAYDKQAAAWEKATADIGAALEPITSYYSWLKLILAEDASNLAKPWIKQKEVIEEVDRAADKKAKQDAQRAAAAAAVAESFRKQREAAEAEKQLGLDAIPAMQLDALKQMIPADQVKKFEQILGMLDEVNQKTMTLDFIANNGDADRMKIYLSEEVKLEFEKVEALEKQAEAVKKRRDLEDQAKKIAEDMRSDPMDKLTDDLAKLMVMKNQGLITEEQYQFAGNRSLDGTSNKGSQLAVDSTRVGSQEAYRYLAGIQDRNLKMQMEQDRKQLAIQNVMADSLLRAEALLAEIADTRMGSDG